MAKPRFDVEKTLDRYIQRVDAYKAYAKFLILLLERVAHELDPFALVQARHKAPASFAEKCLRKADKYKDPLKDMTDLCGARAILRSEEAVGHFAKFVETHFIVDADNSEDKRDALKATEFGYRSVHFVVVLPEDLEAGSAPGERPVRPPFPLSDEERKAFEEVVRLCRLHRCAPCAEIQIRTQLQHVWADVVHDRLYKTKMNLPELYHREASRLAAIMETADRDFQDLMNRIDAYSIDIGAYQSPAQTRAEIDRLERLHKHPKLKHDRPKFALRLAKLFKSQGKWRDVIRVCKPHLIANTSTVHTELALEYAIACTRLGGERLPAGKKLLDKLIASIPAHRADLLGRAHEALGLADLERSKKLAAARAHFYAARKTNPENPYYLCQALECETRNFEGVTNTIHTEIDAAISTCREHVQVGIEIPRSLFTLGKLHFFSNQQHQGMLAYARGVHAASIEQLEQELSSCERLASAFEDRPIFHQAKLLIMLSLVARAESHRAASASKRVLRRALTENIHERLDPAELRSPVLMFVGGSHPRYDSLMAAYEQLLSKGLTGFEGSVFCGGTQSGIPGVLGRIAGAGGANFELLSYLPEQLPDNAAASEGYQRLFRTRKTDDFSYLEPMLSWAHLLLADQKPRRVRVVGINGGDISEFEYYLALSLGARLALVEDSGRAAQRMTQEKPWWDPGQLMMIPADATTLRAFLFVTDPASIDRKQYEPAAKALHEAYAIRHPTSNRWEDLREDFRISNLHQAMYAERILASAGFVLEKNGRRPVTSFPRFSDAEVERMAELEHGRYNVERLAQGWRYGPKRDDRRKLHPLIAPWKAVPPSERQKDRDAVLEFPKALAQIGLSVKRKRGGTKAKPRRRASRRST